MSQKTSNQNKTIFIILIVVIIAIIVSISGYFIVKMINSNNSNSRTEQTSKTKNPKKTNQIPTKTIHYNSNGTSRAKTITYYNDGSIYSIFEYNVENDNPIKSTRYNHRKPNDDKTSLLWDIRTYNFETGQPIKYVDYYVNQKIKQINIYNSQTNNGFQRHQEFEYFDDGKPLKITDDKDGTYDIFKHQFLYNYDGTLSSIRFQPGFFKPEQHISFDSNGTIKSIAYWSSSNKFVGENYYKSDGSIDYIQDKNFNRIIIITDEMKKEALKDYESARQFYELSPQKYEYAQQTRQLALEEYPSNKQQALQDYNDAKNNK
ncbi:DUF2963 domain-containing protein [Candidatus Phytoplasma pruni]|uniref:DUF2963 domain-containing protein n=1 Tax=Candidatus Phytoplasma pruni TaxID=479893 RepID=A0A851HKA9_9MOLU|nr:hypothetical protein [Candidatus Phytoplasma pruni]NWN45869.1 hypothetical protein [Candidatus Phytoplasma pruni]